MVNLILICTRKHVGFVKIYACFGIGFLRTIKDDTPANKIFDVMHDIDIKQSMR